MNDIDFVNNIKENKDVDESIKKLENIHGGLITSISSRFTKLFYDSGFSMEEFNGERPFLIYKTAQTFKFSKKVKFSTYLASYVRWYCLNKINKNKDWKKIEERELDNIIIEEKDKSLLEYLKALVDGFDNLKIKKIFKLRYFSDSKLMSWNNVGKIMGMSGQACNNYHKRSLKLLKNRIKSNHEY